MMNEQNEQKNIDLNTLNCIAGMNKKTLPYLNTLLYFRTVLITLY